MVAVALVIKLMKVTGWAEWDADGERDPLQEHEPSA